MNLNLTLSKQIGLALILGIMLGWFFPEFAKYIKFMGDIFLLLLKMMIAPIVFFSVATGIISIGTSENLTRIGAKTLTIYLLTMGLAVLNGLILVNLIQPGVGAPMIPTALPANLKISQLSFADFFQQQIETIFLNPFAALAQVNVLAIIVFAILLGIAILALNEKSVVLKRGLEAGNEVFMWLIGKIIYLAPYGVFALMANLIAQSGVNVLLALGKYVTTVLLGLSIHVLLVMAPLIWFFGRMNPIQFWRGMSPAVGIAFSTSSSSATLPVSIRCAEENLRLPSRIVGFVLPLGATINMNGTALYESVAALFIAQAYHIHLGFTQQLLVFLTAIAASIGAPGIPNAGLVTMAMVLTAVGLPLEGIGLILAVDRFLDMCRTSVNVLDDVVCATIVAGTEKELIETSSTI